MFSAGTKVVVNATNNVTETTVALPPETRNLASDLLDSVLTNGVSQVTNTVTPTRDSINSAFQPNPVSATITSDGQGSIPVSSVGETSVAKTGTVLPTDTANEIINTISPSTGTFTLTIDAVTPENDVLTLPDDLIASATDTATLATITASLESYVLTQTNSNVAVLATGEVTLVSEVSLLTDAVTLVFDDRTPRLVIDTEAPATNITSDTSNRITPMNTPKIVLEATSTDLLHTKVPLSETSLTKSPSLEIADTVLKSSDTVLSKEPVFEDPPQKELTPEELRPLDPVLVDPTISPVDDRPTASSIPGPLLKDSEVIVPKTPSDEIGFTDPSSQTMKLPSTEALAPKEPSSNAVPLLPGANSDKNKEEPTSEKENSAPKKSSAGGKENEMPDTLITSPSKAFGNIVGIIS